MKFNQKKQSN